MSDTPVETLRDKDISASIWKNEGTNGEFHSVTFQRVYTGGGGETKNTSSFSGTDLLKLSRLAEKAYDRIAELRQ